MELLTRVNKRIEENKTEMISSLSKLISIPSVVSDAKGNMPFGEDVHKAYLFMMQKAEEEGFDLFDADNYGGHIDFTGTEDGIVGIVGHLDVVPEGSGWDFEPYGGEIIDGSGIRSHRIPPELLVEIFRERSDDRVVTVDNEALFRGIFNG